MADLAQMSGSHKPLISVVVCTHNRAELLGRALTSLVEQSFSNADYEIVVVDNGSIDDTRDIVNRFRDDATVRYLYEQRVGTSIARNVGWQASLGRYIAYFDDDAIASPNWLASIREGFSTVSPSIGAIGGRVQGIWEKRRPDWLVDELLCVLTIIDWGSSDKLIENLTHEWLVSANMAIPRALLEEVGGFHPWLGPIGKSLLRNEDTFLQREIMRRGYQCLYRPSMVVGHLVPASRLNKQWFLSRYYWQGISDAVVHLIERRPSVAHRMRLACTRAARIVRSREMALLLSHPREPEEFARRCFALIDVGFIAGLLGAARH